MLEMWSCYGMQEKRTWATLPDPLIATRVEGLVKLYSGQYFAII